ncbi:TRAP transporter small permease [Cloacibacillus evryensis]|uniref:TRAP transporter small permease n=1 Tax=Cloacibacillus evryensis TaxID=508460 RepID=A0AAW5K9K9_9BACT|nr:TRAP transporter small permease [Cloacibacillus evryensis]MCQ4763640.1 TRAP transporter small permease [Cloacibacillus evryensis]MCQ4814972.1 TRAP transporter small permease [Cloacibacillus evryensis]
MRLLEKIAGAVSIFFLGLAILLVTFNVTARYVFNYGEPWCEEAIRYSVVFATFFGLSLAVAKNESMKIDVLVQLTKGKLRRFIHLIGTVAEVVVLWLLLYFSYLLVTETMESGQITPSADYPMFMPYMVVAAGVLVCALSSLYALYNAIKGEK